jgi:uncharacterized protein YdeI (BOF family)
LLATAGLTLALDVARKKVAAEFNRPAPRSSPRLTLEPASTACQHVGDEIVVEVWMRDIADPIVGAQFFLEYDPNTLALAFRPDPNDVIVPGDAPMSVEVFECSLAHQSNAQCVPNSGRLDYAVGVPTPPGSDFVIGDHKLAVLHFAAMHDACNVSGLVDFRLNPPFETRLSTANGAPLVVPLVALPAITIDSTPPVIGGCPLAISQNNDVGLCSAVVTWTAPTAHDDCDGDLMPVGTRSDSLPLAAPFPVGITTVTYNVTDACGNAATPCSFTVTVNDTELPVAHCPGDITVYPDLGGCSAVVTWPAMAADNCPEATIACVPASGSTFSGTTEVTCTATDASDNESTCTFTVTVLDFYAQATATLELQGPLVNEVTRCVRFTFCDSSTGVPVVLDKDVVFPVTLDPNNSIAQVLFNDLPCGYYDCVTAEEPLHTLRSKVTPENVGGQYVADFTGPANMLYQADLNYDNLVDIVDFGVFVALWGWTGDPNTPCGSGLTQHADMDASGYLDVSDFGFISANFLLPGDPGCCGLPLALAPRSSITVDELRRLGCGHLAVADLNHDGMVGVSDMAAFAQGVRPGPRPVEVDTTDTEPQSAASE